MLSEVTELSACLCIAQLDSVEVQSNIPSFKMNTSYEKLEKKKISSQYCKKHYICYNNWDLEKNVTSQNGCGKENG